MISFMTKEYEKQQNEIQSLKEYIAKNKARASTANSAKSRENTLEKLELIENPKEYTKSKNTATSKFSTVARYKIKTHIHTHLNK